MSLDPTNTDPDKYAVIFENERVETTQTHSIFIELKEPGPPAAAAGAALGPSGAT